MHALIIGATGATGKNLVDTLLSDSDYARVTVFARKSTGKIHPKLTEHIIDFSEIEQYASFIVGDVFFSCLGTTLKAAGSKANQWKIDFDIPAQFARLARENDLHTCVLVSSYGASAGSKLFYSRMKGELEDAIGAMNFPQYIVFKPGALIRENSDRFFEKLGVNVLRAFNSIGLLRKYKPLHTKILAEKLTKSPRIFPDGVSVVEADKIGTL